MFGVPEVTCLLCEIRTYYASVIKKDSAWMHAHYLHVELPDKTGKVVVLEMLW